MDQALEDLSLWREITFQEPQRLWLALPLALVLFAAPYMARRSRRGMFPALVCRGLGLMALVAVMMLPRVPYTEPRPGRLIVMVDVSPSMGEAGRNEAAGLLRAASPPFDLIVFGESARLVASPQTHGWSDVLSEDSREATDIAEALSLAMARSGAGGPVRAVLLSDGRATEPGAEAAALELRRRGIDLRAFGLPDRGFAQTGEFRARRLILPSRSERREPFAVRAEVFSDMATTARAVLYVDGQRRTGRDVELKPGQNTILFPKLALPPGSYDVQVALEGDGTPLDNVVSENVVVPGVPKVLCLASKERKALVAEALKAQGFNVVVDDVQGRKNLDAYDAIVLLPDAPADELEARAHELATFLGQRGGGLLAIGGVDGAGLGRLHGTPTAFLLPLDVEPRAPQEEPPPKPEPGDQPRIEVHEEEAEAFRITLCLLVDTSGSMQGPKLRRAQEAAAAAARTLTKSDRIAVLAFSDRVVMVVPPRAAGDPAPVLRALKGLRAGGNTAMFRALSAGYRLLDEEKTPVRHLVLLSDGISTDQGRWRDLITRMASRKVTLSTIGIGFDVEQRRLAKFAQWGHGRWWAANHPHEIPQVVTLDTQRVVKA
ncbi:MAG: VWA domain-containing protein, partial [Planctomycetota bacterium]|nr:VWA domain-containing protein [Planctomycetota bacterium]